MVLTTSKKSSANDDINAHILARAAMLRSEKYATLQHVYLGESKHTDFRVGILIPMHSL